MPLPEARFAVLMFTDIVNSTGLKHDRGVPAYLAAFERHNALFEGLARGILGMQILQHTGDGYFASFTGVAEAVRFALVFQDAMRREPWSDVALVTRVGIHTGEVTETQILGRANVLGPAADLTSRVMSLAVGGQILLTRTPFDEARPFIREHPPVDGEVAPALRWLAHGPYLLKGRDEPMEIFEIGAESLAPLTPPPDSEKAKRAIRAGEEETLGWRPADGLEIPGRPGWRLVEKLGAGGFGEVWAGEQAKTRERRAFKFCFDAERLRALKREVTLTRLLRETLGERDDIVRIHDLRLDQPPYFLESELATDGNLLQWAEKQGGLASIPIETRLEIVAATATALAAAHSVGVLHKDIKPTNVLIFTDVEGRPHPRLVDFGIGTLADPSVLAQHGITGAGFTHASIKHSTGTPTYSPPEYIAGRPFTVQGDIYALGVMLYQLAVADSTRPIGEGWQRDVKDELLREDIAQCVDVDPARRLPSAADLATRLRSLKARRAEVARRLQEAQFAEQAAAAARREIEQRTRARRLRALATAFAILALLAIAGAVLARMNQQKANDALGEVARKKAEVDRKNDEYRAMLVEAARSDRLVAEEKLRAGDDQAAFAHLARACEYDPASTLAAEKAAVALNTWRRRFPTVILAGHQGPVKSAQFSRDGTRIVTASNDETARVWDAATGQCLATLAGHQGTVTSAQFSPDGTRIVTASGENTARIWDSAKGQILATLTGHKSNVTSAAFSPDGTRIVTASRDKTARVWDAATGQSLATLAGHQNIVTSAQFSPDGTRIATSSDDTTARVWDVVTGKSLVTLGGREVPAYRVAFSPEGSRIVTWSVVKTACVWDAATGRILATLAGHHDVVDSVQFSPDGAHVTTVSGDNTVQVWDAATVQILATLAGHQDSVTSAQFSPDGTRIVTASYDKTARVWDAAMGEPLAAFKWVEGGVSSAEVSPDGRCIVTASADKTARVWDAATGESLAMLSGHDGSVNSAQFSPDGTRIATVSYDKVSHENTVRVWDVATGKSLATFAGPQLAGVKAQFSPDGTRIITNYERKWLPALLTRTIPKSDYEIARVWDAATGQSLAILPGHGNVTSAQFSPDGSRIVTASSCTARVWDAATGKSLVTLAGHEFSVESAQFSPDGKRIVTASADKTARVWDTATGKTLAILAGHQEPVVNVQFSPDGTRIVTESRKRVGVIAVNGIRVAPPDWAYKTARVWNIIPSSAGPPPDWFADFLRYVAQMRLNADGELVGFSADEWLKLRDRMRGVRRANAGQDTPYLRILRRFVTE